MHHDAGRGLRPRQAPRRPRGPPPRLGRERRLPPRGRRGHHPEGGGLREGCDCAGPRGRGGGGGRDDERRRHAVLLPRGRRGGLRRLLCSGGAPRPQGFQGGRGRGGARRRAAGRRGARGAGLGLQRRGDGVHGLARRRRDGRRLLRRARHGALRRLLGVLGRDVARVGGARARGHQGQRRERHVCAHRAVRLVPQQARPRRRGLLHQARARRRGLDVVRRCREAAEDGGRVCVMMRRRLARCEALPCRRRTRQARRDRRVRAPRSGSRNTKTTNKSAP
mmetsp:Transcript_48954/g.122336  ORF Transcript_48954/g.122336 Transcript_48954/m.122336 type:complete len:279 (-) Transcript_48954:159-995(-)